MTTLEADELPPLPPLVVKTTRRTQLHVQDATAFYEIWKAWHSDTRAVAGSFTWELRQATAVDDDVFTWLGQYKMPQRLWKWAKAIQGNQL